MFVTVSLMEYHPLAGANLGCSLSPGTWVEYLQVQIISARARLQEAIDEGNAYRLGTPRRANVDLAVAICELRRPGRGVSAAYAQRRAKARQLIERVDPLAARLESVARSITERVATLSRPLERLSADFPMLRDGMTLDDDLETATQTLRGLRAIQAILNRRLDRVLELLAVTREDLAAEPATNGQVLPG